MPRRPEQFAEPPLTTASPRAQGQLPAAPASLAERQETAPGTADLPQWGRRNRWLPHGAGTECPHQAPRHRLAETLARTRPNRGPAQGNRQTPAPEAPPSPRPPCPPPPELPSPRAPPPRHRSTRAPRAGPARPRRRGPRAPPGRPTAARAPPGSPSPPRPSPPPHRPPFFFCRPRPRELHTASGVARTLRGADQPHPSRKPGLGFEKPGGNGKAEASARGRCSFQEWMEFQWDANSAAGTVRDGLG